MIRFRESTNMLMAGLLCMLIMSGCGGDRSTLYDESGHKIDDVKKTTWIYETADGKTMLAHNFVYIPGGFDVDGDGINESGFWLAKYEARESNVTVPTAGLGNIDDVIRNHFMLYNAQSKQFDKLLPATSGYSTRPVSEILNFSTHKVFFSDEGNATGEYSALEAVVALDASQIEGAPWHISLPSEKQWMQVVKLVINNPENWNSGEVKKGKLYQGKKYTASERRYFVISNGVLAEDTHVPKDYSIRIYDISGNLAEWTSGIVEIDDRFAGGGSGEVEYTALGELTPRWWKPILEGQSTPLASIYGVGKYHDGSNSGGTADVLDITGSTGYVDPYAVVARGGSYARGDQTLVGVGAAKLDFGPGYKDPAIGFRAASDYLP